MAALLLTSACWWVVCPGSCAFRLSFVRVSFCCLLKMVRVVCVCVWGCVGGGFCICVREVSFCLSNAVGFVCKSGFCAWSMWFLLFVQRGLRFRCLAVRFQLLLAKMDVVFILLFFRCLSDFIFALSKSSSSSVLLLV